MIAILLVVALLVGVFFVFFGGGVSKEEFIEQADAICKAALEDSSEIPPPTDLEATGNLFSEVTPILQEQTRDIRALERPEEDQEVLEDWLNTQDQLVEVFQIAADEATAGNQQGFDDAFTEANAIQAQSNRLAADYGFGVCGITTTS